MRKIYTKKGDAGYTSILGKRSKIPKHDIIIKCSGSIDEVNSYVGMIRSFHDILTLETIQNNLFTIGSIISGSDKMSISDEDTEELEKSMDIMSKSLSPLKNFILPGGNQTVCYCHLARTVCRRAERNLSEMGKVCSKIMKYINRLSDYLFVLARFISKEYNIPETIWSGKRGEINKKDK